MFVNWSTKPPRITADLFHAVSPAAFALLTTLAGRSWLTRGCSYNQKFADLVWLSWNCIRWNQGRENQKQSNQPQISLHFIIYLCLCCRWKKLCVYLYQFQFVFLFKTWGLQWSSLWIGNHIYIQGRTQVVDGVALSPYSFLFLLK